MSTRPPNVLLITADDLRGDYRGDGYTAVQTPNLDRLAGRGMTFERAYCQYPLCNPSRASMLTGMRPDQIRVYDLKTRFRDSVPEVVTLPECFKKRNYFSGRVGKIYHGHNPRDIGSDGLDDDPSWNQKVNPMGRDKIELGSKVINYTPTRKFGSSMSLHEDHDGCDEDYTDGKVASETIRMLEENQSGPFFIGAGFYKPHSPYILPKKYFDLYPLDTIRLPQLPKTLNGPPYLGVTREQAIEIKRAYFAATTFLDVQIGKILDALDRLNLWERTIVVFVSDHGYHLGEHGCWEKKSLFEESCRVPLLVAAPNLGQQGGVCPRVVELLDVFPTLTDLAGLAAPKHLAGVSLRPLLQHPRLSWDRPAMTQCVEGGRSGYSIRTEKWRYTEWNGGSDAIELYDEESDFKEEINRARDARYRKTVEMMKESMKEYASTHLKQ